MGQRLGTPHPARKVRVGIVDDADDMRLLLRYTFEDDARFEVVGEAADGAAAIELVEATRPDLLILDSNMPEMSGVEALPEIRRRSAATAVVLYTAAASRGTYQSALAAGALDVLEKTGEMQSLVDHLSDILMEHWAKPDADVEIRVGPLPSSTARIWVDNTFKIVAALRAHPEVLDPRVPDDVLDTFDRVLGSWRDVASTTAEFSWVARWRVADAERIVDHWARIDAMSDDQLGILGVQWSPPEARPFFVALTRGVLSALSARAETQGRSESLARQWESAIREK